MKLKLKYREGKHHKKTPKTARTSRRTKPRKHDRKPLLPYRVKGGS